MGQIGSLFSGASGLGGIASGIGSLFGGSGGSSPSSGGTSQAQTPSEAPIDTPGTYQDPTQSVGQGLQDIVQAQGDQPVSGQDPAATIGGTQSGVQDPEIVARQNQQRQAHMPPAPPQTPGLEALQSPQQLARLAAQALGPPNQNPWQLGSTAAAPAAPTGGKFTNRLAPDTEMLSKRIPAAPAPQAPVTVGGRGGGGYGQNLSGAAQPDLASALRSQLPTPSSIQISSGGRPIPITAPVTTGGRGGEPGYGQTPPTTPASPQATIAQAPSPLAQTAQQAQARKAAEASNFAGQDHDPSIPRSGTPGLDQVKSRLASVESAGGPNNGYGSVGPTVTNRRGVQGQGIGKYQVMSYNVGPWTERFLGQRMTPQQFLQNPHAQDRLATAVMKHLHRQYGNWQDVASVWRTGHPVAHHFAARRPIVNVSRSQMPDYSVQHHGRS